MAGEPDEAPIVPVEMPELRQKGYRAYKLVEHVANKITATFEDNPHSGASVPALS
jgi:hypothetical protein